ncbi:MAG: hypothetical protein RQM90_10140 [Methanoculleus sp.]
MFSYFSDPDNVEHFSIGFDLAGKHLPESVIIQIIAEIEGVQEDYPDDRNAVIALDALTISSGNDLRRYPPLHTIP